MFLIPDMVITEHIRNIVEEGELVESAVCGNHAQPAADGKSGRGLEDCRTPRRFARFVHHRPTLPGDGL
jgi:hypothetical protein